MGLVGAIAGWGKRAGDRVSPFTTADAYGRVPLPGAAELTLPAGKVRVWYQESIESVAGEDIYFNRPTDLTVTVTPAAGGEALALTGPGIKGKGHVVATVDERTGRVKRANNGLYTRRNPEPGQAGATTPGRSIDLHGTVTVTSPGTYLVTAVATVRPGAVEPVLLVGAG